VAGRTASFGAGDDDAWVLRLNGGDGSPVWQKRYGGAGYDAVSAIASTAHCACVVAVETSSFGAGDNDAWVLKLDATGSGYAGCGQGEPSAAVAVDSTATAVDTSATMENGAAVSADSSATVSNTAVEPGYIEGCALTHPAYFPFVYRDYAR
jgi:hypothetical protein